MGAIIFRRNLSEPNAAPQDPLTLARLVFSGKPMIVWWPGAELHMCIYISTLDIHTLTVDNALERLGGPHGKSECPEAPE